MYLKLLSILFISIGLFSCGEKSSDKSIDTQKPDLLADVPFRKAPVLDTTNFDNFNRENPLSEELISKLQLRKIEADYEMFHPRYRLALSTPVDMVVITMAIENEMKTYLISYRKSDPN
jgi:hypothetical protein